MSDIPKTINSVQVPVGKSIDDLKTIINAGGNIWSAFTALAVISNKESLELLKFYSNSDDWRIRRAAIEALSSHARSNESYSIIVEALTDESEYVVRTACESVSKFSIMNAHGNILRLMKFKDQETRISALDAISTIWMVDDFELVLKIYKTDPIVKVRKEAAWTLRKNVSKNIWRKLFDLWKKDKLHRHRIWACAIANDYGTVDIIDDLENLKVDSDGHIRKIAHNVYRSYQQ